MLSNMFTLARGASILLSLFLSLQAQPAFGEVHTFNVSVPIPADLTAADVIAALHDHNNVLTLQAFTTGHTLENSTDPDVLNDPYFNPPNQSPITTYMVSECVPVIPDIGDLGKKCISFPSSFQDTEDGIKTRADAQAGVIVRAEFFVANATLQEHVELTANALLMPFVAPKMEDAHKDICQKLVDQVEAQKNGSSSASSRRVK